MFLFLFCGDYNEANKAKLDKLETRRDELLATASMVPSDLDALPDLIPDALARYRGKVASFADLLDGASASQVARFKSLLRSLLGSIPFYPNYRENVLDAAMPPNEKALARISGIPAPLHISLVAGARFVR